MGGRGVVLHSLVQPEQPEFRGVWLGLGLRKFSPQGDLEGDAQVLVVHLLEVDLDDNVEVHLLDVPQVQLSLHFQRLPLRLLVLLEDQII